ncbi:MAG: aspartate 1-decarboxylase [Omnitrophica WOR_2 bacterium RBG_13_41_10]|nr:MAG: aspartate 1-decarboxylase [Omnitrophica WOR_2 bacterium RBG_13_41_10]
MLRQVLKSKIHNATVTKKELYYEGSIGIDKALLLKSNILPNEKVQVVNLNNGARLETYVIGEKENSGIIALYGPAARQGEVGDRICIILYGLAEDNEVKLIKPQVILLDDKNKIKNGTLRDSN